MSNRAYKLYEFAIGLLGIALGWILSPNAENLADIIFPVGLIVLAGIALILSYHYNVKDKQ